MIPGFFVHIGQGRQQQLGANIAFERLSKIDKKERGCNGKDRTLVGRPVFKTGEGR